MAGGSLLSRQNSRSGQLITEINVTPFVDIMLVLLIIFMLTTSHIVRDSLDVTLPKASTGEPRNVGILALTLDAQGEVKLNGAPTTDQGIRTFILDQRARGAEVEAVIAADTNAVHGNVVRLIDLIRANGVTKFGINVLRPE